MPRPLVILFLAALALRLAWDCSRPAALDANLGDQAEYLSLARNLIQTGEYRFYDDRFGQWIYAYRTPGYPLFVAAFGADPRFVRVAQAVLDMSTVIAIYLLARRLAGAKPRAAFVAAGLVAFNPFLIYFTGLVLSETLFTALLAWGMSCLIMRGRVAQIAGLGLLAGAVLVRPSAIVLVPLLALVAALVRRRLRDASTDGVEGRLGGTHAVLDVCLTCVAVVAVLLPWAHRNSRHPAVGVPIWTTTNNGITLYDGFHDGATGASDQKVFLDRLGPELRGMTEVGRDLYLGERARRWIGEHVGQSLWLAGAKIGRTWSPVPLSSEYGSRAYVAVGLVFSLPLYLLILVGLCAPMGGKTLKAFCLVPAIYFTAVHALSVGSLRYRVPCEPPMAVLAGAGAAVLSNGWRSKSKSSPA